MNEVGRFAHHCLEIYWLDQAQRQNWLFRYKTYPSWQSIAIVDQGFFRRVAGKSARDTKREADTFLYDSGLIIVLVINW